MSGLLIIWKRALLFFFSIPLCFFNGQVILQNSNNKSLEKIEILRENGNKELLNKNNLHSFMFDDGDKVSYQNKTYDFSVYQDTLVFFDKTKKIEEVQMIKVDFQNKKNNSFKSAKVNAVATLPSNNWNGTLIKIKPTKRRTYIRSITLFPQEIYDHTGKIEVQIIENINDLPNSNNLLNTFEINFSDAKKNKWEIELPRIIRYPTNGFFLILYYKTEEKTEKMLLKLTSNSPMYYYYPSKNEWKALNFNGFLYKLKVLQ